MKLKPKILLLQSNPDMDRVLALHKTDRFKARVLVKNDPAKYKQHEIALFEIEGSDAFTIVDHMKVLRMSINNKAYFYDENRIVYCYKGGKFWFINKTKKRNIIKPLCYADMYGEIKDEILLRFRWMRTIHEFQEFYYIPFTTIVKYELYSFTNLLRYQYKTNFPTAKLLRESKIEPKDWKIWKKFLINTESINPELIQPDNYGGINSMFKDSVKLAEILDKKINCKWGPNRLKQEHDQWAKEITSIVMESSNRLMTIGDVYLEFQKFSGFNMISTTKDLAIEGLTQSHCVASYVSSVENGNCAIFHIDGYTAEIRRVGNQLSLGQFKGLRNCESPGDLKERVRRIIENFNEKKITELSKKQEQDTLAF